MSLPRASDQVPWLLAALVLLAASIPALRWAAELVRTRWMTGAGLGVALLAAAVHQFAVAALALALLVALGILRWRELWTGPGRIYLAALALWLVGWLAYGAVGAVWSDGAQSGVIARDPYLTVIYNLFRFPDFILEIVVPWGRSVPRLALAIALATASALIIAGTRDARISRDLRLTLFLFLCLLGAAAASNPPRHETRYVFFLFPVAITILLWALQRLVGAMPVAGRLLPATSALAVLALFATTEDAGLRTPGSGPATSRSPSILFPAAGDGHRIGRADNRGVAAWLRANAHPPRDFIVNASPGVDFYYDAFDVAFIDWHHQRFLVYACDRGRRERWGDLPLIYSANTLRRAVESRDRTLIVAPLRQAEQLQRGALAALRPVIAFTSTDGRLGVLAVSVP